MATTSPKYGRKIVRIIAITNPPKKGRPIIIGAQVS